MRAVPHLPARNLGSLFPLLFGDHSLEEPGANHIRAFANDQRTVAVFGLYEINTGKVSAVVRVPERPMFLSRNHLSHGPDVIRPGAAAAAHNVEPAVIDEPFQLRRQ